MNEKMNLVANEVRDIAYNNDLQAGVVAADENGLPLAVIVGDETVLEEVASILKSDHDRKNAPEPDPVVIPDPPATVQKKPGFLKRLFGF